MARIEKSVTVIIAGTITTLVVYLAVRLWASDAAFSIIPGWHTTLYPRDITIVILTSAILVSSLFVSLLFRGIIRLLITLWIRFK